ncbi:hypothetical protein FG386_003621 [Cryptosporidium ryanae]|uniref:uncharacterized protein n=1 Tax=Cryptosporidium ryanae TaxID=515981 RepID=UPI00351A874F|nr:hypothetical protein FG386_003621 [Cryptosporidium ryanae]
MDNYLYSEINEDELLDNDRNNDETFEVGDVGDDWVPSITLTDFEKRINGDQMAKTTKLEELIKSKVPLTVEEIEEAMMSQDFFNYRTNEKNIDMSFKELDEIEHGQKKNRSSLNRTTHSSSFHRQRNQNSSGGRNDYRNNNTRNNRHNNENFDSEAAQKESEPLPIIPFNKYIFPLTIDHIKRVIKDEMTHIPSWSQQNPNFNPSINNNLMVSRDFDIILRIQLQQMAERPEIQSYSSKWNRRLLAKKHNIQLVIESNQEKEGNPEFGESSNDPNNLDKNKNKEGSCEVENSTKIRKFGKSTYSSVRGARELIKVHGSIKDENPGNLAEANDQNINKNQGVDSSFPAGNQHCIALTKMVYDILHDPIFNEKNIKDEVYYSHLSISGPMFYSIIEAGNDLLQDIYYYDYEIENCPAGHLHARLRLDQELRDAIDLTFQLLFGFSKHRTQNLTDRNDHNSPSYPSERTNEISQCKASMANLSARKWLMGKILSIRKGRHFILSLFHMPHISESYITILLETVLSCRDALLDLFKYSSIILPPLMALVPRAFRHRQGQDILAPHEGFGYSGNVSKLIEDWMVVCGVNDKFDEKFITKEDLTVRARLGVKVLETTAFFSNRIMQLNMYGDSSSIIHCVKAITQYYDPNTIEKCLPYSSGVVFLSLLYNSISIVPRQIEELKNLTKILVGGFTSYLVDKDSKGLAKIPIKLSPNALKDSEPIVLCVLQRSTNDPNLRSVLMNSISEVVSEDNKDKFIFELQELIVKSTSSN